MQDNSLSRKVVLEEKYEMRSKVNPIRKVQYMHYSKGSGNVHYLVQNPNPVCVSVTIKLFTRLSC